MNKNQIIKYVTIALIVLVAMGVYFYMNGTDTPSSGLEGSSVEDQIGGERILALLNQINRLEINDSLFRDPVYMSLHDYTVVVPTLPVGRGDPFAPIPGMVTENVDN